MSRPQSELARQCEVAEWAYALGGPCSTPKQLCELIVTALAAHGFLRGHAPTRAGAAEAFATTVEERS